MDALVDQLRFAAPTQSPMGTSAFVEGNIVGMTATWELEATTAENEPVGLHFYSGPAARPPDYIQLQGFARRKGKKLIREFDNQWDADDWASALGVERWDCVRHSRAFPEAAVLPIRFDEAPDDATLHELIEALERGSHLSDLLVGFTISVGDSQYPVSPTLMSIWLLGVSPDHPTLQRFRRFTRRDSKR